MRRSKVASREGLRIEIFQGVVYGSMLGVGVVFSISWGVLALRSALGIELEAGYNVNYANVLALRDQLWGTFHAPRDFDGEYGITPFRDAYPQELAERSGGAKSGPARAAQPAQ